MKLARNAERLIEQLVDRVAGVIFPGFLHPNELSVRLLRSADLSLVSGALGLTAPNQFVIRVNPDELPVELSLDELTDTLENVMEEHAADRSWRLTGPVTVLFELDNDVGRGKVKVESSSIAGNRRPWGFLAGDIGRFGLSNNRCLVGRGDQCDVRISDDTVSRAHALIIRDNQQLWVEDLGSANSTRVEGAVISSRTLIEMGDVIEFGNVRLNLVGLSKGQAK